jgi:hypothetical protein
MNVDKYTLYDERGELLDCLAVYDCPQTRARLADLSDQINLVEGVQSIGSMHDPRTFGEIAADELAADEEYTREVNRLP